MNLAFYISNAVCKENIIQNVSQNIRSCLSIFKNFNLPMFSSNKQSSIIAKNITTNEASGDFSFR